MGTHNGFHFQTEFINRPGQVFCYRLCRLHDSVCRVWKVIGFKQDTFFR